MEWNEAIERYAINKSLQVKTKNPMDVINKTTSDIKDILNQIPELASKNVNEITEAFFHEMLNAYRKKNGWHWDAILDSRRGVYSGKYNDLVRCLVFARDGFACKICGRSASEYPKLELHLDHKKPKAQRGDPFSLDNLQCACGFCNLGKQTKTDEEVIEEIKQISGSLAEKKR